MSLSTFSTERLILRDWRTDLGDPTLRDKLFRDLGEVLTPPVLAPLPPPLQLDNGLNAIARWVTDRAEESEVSVIRDAATGDILGLLILAMPTDPTPTVHLGYLLAQHAWGKGYATEVLSGLVVQAAACAPVTLIGGVARDNPASARVLSKAGFKCDLALSTFDTDTFVLSLV